jgi:hypothetical protein
MVFEWKVSGKNMKEPVITETTGETSLQAMFKARDKAFEEQLDWDEIEYNL